MAIAKSCGLGIVTEKRNKINTLVYVIGTLGGN
jgi:hypothetical protein